MKDEYSRIEGVMKNYEKMTVDKLNFGEGMFTFREYEDALEQTTVHIYHLTNEMQLKGICEPRDFRNLLRNLRN